MTPALLRDKRRFLSHRRTLARAANDGLLVLGKWENGLGSWLCAFLSIRQTRRVQQVAVMHNRVRLTAAIGKYGHQRMAAGPYYGPA